MHLAHHTFLSIPVSLLIFSAVYTTHAMPIDSEAGVGSFSTLGTTVVLGTRDAVVNTGLHAWIPNPFLMKDTVNVFCIDHRPSDDKTRKRETKPLKEDPKLQQSIRELVVAGKGAMGLRGRGDPEVKYTWKSWFLEMCRSQYEFLYGYGVLVWWRG
ncbi:hypothetical protein GGU11DRAFT_334943 [Lentinula aff. detonsa]|nr:hypothetical protein GGU11DRAFT_334943 [Lentinula aff. detonsa]